jgi:deoxyribonucleoside regulator
MNNTKTPNEGFNSELIIKVARMYYEDELKQNNIADNLNLTQSQVSVMLKEAKQKGFIKINIAPPIHQDLQQELISRYPHLIEAIIVDCQDDANLKTEIGKAAAKYFEQNVRNEDVIAISCGTTIGSMINRMTADKYSILEVAPLIVTGVGRMVGWTPVSLVAKLLSNYNRPGVIGYGYQPPPFTDQKEGEIGTKDYYLDNTYVKKALEKAIDADITFIGIGLISKKHKAFEFSRFLEDHQLEHTVYDSAAIGEICYQPFDKNGRVLIEDEQFEALRNCFIYVPVQKLIEKADSDYYRVVAVAGGKAKETVIRTSLKMKCYNVLICDIAVAEKLCSEKT